VTDRRARELGELMAESHTGYSACGLGTARTDAIVEAARKAGWARGLAGARVSGGGSGGTVVVLGREDAEPLVREIAQELGAGLVGGSSAGAEGFGVRVLARAPSSP
jgi:galactokinase